MSSATPNEQRQRFDAHQRRLDTAVLAALALSPLALGGTHPVAAAGLFAAFTLLSIAAYVIHCVFKRGWRQFIPLWMLVALCAWVLLRTTPVFSFLNPEIARDAWTLWPDLIARGGLAPGRSALWVARTLTLVATASYAAVRFSRTDKIPRAALAIVAAGTVVAIVGALQSVFGADKILGVYSPLDWSRLVPLAGPFVNPNQAGALVGLAAVVALGGTRFAAKQQHRIALGILCIPLLAYVVLLDARGALIAVLAAAVTFFASRLLEELQPTLRASIVTAWTLLLGGVAMLLLYVILPSRAAQGDASSTLVAKMKVWEAALQVPLRAPLTGFGPRAFQDAFSALGLNTNHVWIEDPESGPLQFAAEHGLVLAVLLVVGGATVFFRAVRNSPKSSAALAATLNAATVYVVVETITGMGLHASAYLALVGIVVGVIVGRAARESARPAWSWRLSFQPAAMAAVTLLCAIMLPGSIRTSLHDSHVPLEHVLRAERLSSPAIDRALTRASRQTPGNPALILQAAYLASARGDDARAFILAQGLRHHAPNVQNMSAASIQLAFKSGQPTHACTWLAEHEARFQTVPLPAVEAVIQSGLPIHTCLTTDAALLNAYAALRRSANKDAALALILELAGKPSPSHAVMLAAIDASVGAKMPAIATLWVYDLLEQEGELSEPDYDALLRWAAAMPAPATDRLDLFASAAAAHPYNANFRIRYVEVYVQGITDDAPSTWYDDLLPVIDAARSLARGDRPLARRVQWVHAEAAWRAGRFTDADALYERLPPTGLTSPEQALMQFRRGEVARQQNDYYRAKRHYEQALELQPRFTEARQALDDIGG